MTSELPKLIVFDLDYTLWPFYVELHYTKPYRKTEENLVVDLKDNHVKHYPEVPEVIKKLDSMNVDLALASRTCEIEGANQLIDLFGWRPYFKHIEIYPGSKIRHFKEFKKQTPHEFSEMLFFDDDEINVKEVSDLDVTCYHVQQGISVTEVEKGLQMYRTKSVSCVSK